MDYFYKGSKDVFKKAYDFVEADMIRQLNIYPYYQTIDYNEGPKCIIEGKEVIMLGSNNYLGLTTHPEVRQAAMDAINEYGTSLTGSRLLNGTHKLHLKLEEDLAAFFNKESCLVFSTGYQANIGVLSALISKSNLLIMDKMDHASIYDGYKVSRGDVISFKHNDMEDLDNVLASADKDVGKLIMVDGVFSMEGDVAKLDDLVALKQKYNTRLVVDDAHGVGVIGPGGRGTAHHYGLQDHVDLIVGTFSKSLASVGGFVVGNYKVVDFIKHYGRSIVFSASIPPASTAAANKALDILKREPERVERVQENSRYMRENLVSHGFDVGGSETPIVPIVVGNEILALTLWRELLDLGVYVNSVVYPAVPRDRAVLRTSYTSEHKREDLDKALEALVTLKKKHGF
ncbi:pyridoxal phosphate-dependent aminotransferase family protein [bacterium]|nr:pyridoxal phosphate-dependent aminotransferase family protein [bacterium]MBU1918117.1 pyridoxal phosphate-dependent aminotransferase family protein [bacterium]